MCHEGSWIVTRRTALALLPWLCLAAAGAGCSPGGPKSNGAAEIPDRLKKMRTHRGTGDPRRQATLSSSPADAAGGAKTKVPRASVPRPGAPGSRTSSQASKAHQLLVLFTPGS
jgi:hypothetical protein